MTTTIVLVIVKAIIVGTIHCRYCWHKVSLCRNTKEILAGSNLRPKPRSKSGTPTMSTTTTSEDAVLEVPSLSSSWSNYYLNDDIAVLVPGFYTQSDFRAGFLRRNPAVTTAWPTLATTELPARASAGGWSCPGGEGIGGDLPSGRKRTSPGGGIWQLFFGKSCCFELD